MATGFMRGGHETPCDLHIIIRRCNRNGLKCFVIFINLSVEKKILRELNRWYKIFTAQLRTREKLKYNWGPKHPVLPVYDWKR